MPDPEGARVLLGPDVAVVDGLRLTDPCVLSYLQAVDEAERVGAVARLVGVGAACLERAGNQQDLDVLRREIDAALVHALERALSAAGVGRDGALASRFRVDLNEALRPIRDTVRLMAREQARAEGAKQVMQRTPLKGVSAEKHVFHVLKQLEVQAGARVTYVGGDGKPGDIQVNLPSLGRPDHRDVIIVEVKDRADARGMRVLTKESRRRLEARGAHASVWVNMSETGFASEVGSYSVGDDDLGIWTATTAEYLLLAINHTQVRLHMQYLAQARPDVDTSRIEGCLQRFEVTVARLRTVKVHVGRIVSACGSIREEANIMYNEAQAAIRDAMAALRTTE